MEFKAKKLRQRVLQYLREKDGELQFDKSGRDFLRALVEVAAWVEDDVHAEAALGELVKVMVGLERSAPVAGAQLREVISQSPTAIRRFARLKTKPQVRFATFTATVAKKLAPQLGASSNGRPLYELIPHNNRLTCR